MKRREFLAGSAAVAALPRVVRAQNMTPNIPLPPGAIIAHSPANTKRYLGSPALAVLPDGTYFAAHDDFGPGGKKDTTWLYVSRDKGIHWQSLAEIRGQYWSSLFYHRDALYLLGQSREYGFLVIRRSADGGKTWTEPRDENTGLLRNDGKYHCAPVPVVVHNGRIYRACEDGMGPGGWGKHFRAFVMSAPEDTDLLRRENWTFSNTIARDASWLDEKFNGWLEGNAVVTPAGEIVNILRVDLPPGADEKAAILKLSADGKTLSFDAQNGFTSFPGGAKKFTIRRDMGGGGYWSLSSIILPQHKATTPGSVRNTLALIHSPDLLTWNTRAILLHHPDQKRHGFQYVDWLYDGADIVAVIRTAFDDATGGAPNQHDSNFITFKRFTNFRNLTLDNENLTLR